MTPDEEEQAILDRLDFDMEYDHDVYPHWEHYDVTPEVEYQTVAEIEISLGRTVLVVLAGVALVSAWVVGMAWVVRAVIS